MCPDDETAARATLQEWTTVADAIRATTKRLAKSAILERYFAALADEDLAIAARFFSGIVFPRHDMRTTKVGWSAVSEAILTLSGVDSNELRERAIAAGDMGDLTRELFADRAPSGITLGAVVDAFDEMAATSGSIAKRGLVRALLAPLGGAEMQYVVKLLLGAGELRIGLKEAQVEDALARAFGRPVAEVRHANRLRGDIGEVARLARHDRLTEARLSLFHPLGFMLAQPLATAEEIAATLPAPFAVEDKYDGIRAQAHIGVDDTGAWRVSLYSRTLDEITHGYPEVAAALSAWMQGMQGMQQTAGISGPPASRDSSSDDASLHPSIASRVAGDANAPPSAPTSLILDGELLAYDPADPSRSLPFKALQRRLGRKAPDAAMLSEVPVQLVVYDVLAWDRTLVLEAPYAQRRARLGALDWPAPFARLAPNVLASTAEDVEAAFVAAREAGNEGIIAKSLDSPYTPGRRGKLWIKLKKALATLDVVITGAERGHGRRAKVLSDYTFAVRASETDPTLLNVGKAYNGLTDADIELLSERLQAITVQRFGRFQQVRPEIVLEVTFDIVQVSSRHKAGYALRFPRIVRVRDDKPVSEIDTLARVKELAGE